MQTAVNYFSFVMEITEVDFSILSFNHDKKLSKNGRDENQANSYGKQIHASLITIKPTNSSISGKFLY